MALPMALQPLARYADFTGRSRRREFWMFWLARTALFVSICALFYVLGTAIGAGGASGEYSDVLVLSIIVLSLVWVAAALGLFIPTLASGVRRLHDSNKSGWWLALPPLLAIAGFILLSILHADAFAALRDPERDWISEDGVPPVLRLISNGILLVWLPHFFGSVLLFVFNLLDGTPRPNRFGPDPKGRGSDEAAAQTFA
ncbi:MAG: DUF805 domain-containing protein [Asticcacaulis sp.]